MIQQLASHRQLQHLSCVLTVKLVEQISAGSYLLHSSTQCRIHRLSSQRISYKLLSSTANIKVSTLVTALLRWATIWVLLDTTTPSKPMNRSLFHFKSSSVRTNEYITQGSHSLGWKKFQYFSRTFQDPEAFIQDTAISQQCLNIATNSS